MNTVMVRGASATGRTAQRLVKIRGCVSFRTARRYGHSLHIWRGPRCYVLPRLTTILSGIQSVREYPALVTVCKTDIKHRSGKGRFLDGCSSCFHSSPAEAEVMLGNC